MYLMAMKVTQGVNAPHNFFPGFFFRPPTHPFLSPVLLNSPKLLWFKGTFPSQWCFCKVFTKGTPWEVFPHPTFAFLHLLYWGLFAEGLKWDWFWHQSNQYHQDWWATVVPFSAALNYSDIKYGSFRANSYPAEVSRSLAWISVIFM